MRHRDTASPPLPCACSSLRSATRVVSRHYEAFLAPTGTTATQFSILRLLQCDGPRPLSRIAEALVMERTTLYRALAPLERSGLIRLRDDAADSRAKCAVAEGAAVVCGRGRRRGLAGDRLAPRPHTPADCGGAVRMNESSTTIPYTEESTP